MKSATGKGISRRTLLKGMAAVVTSAGLAGCSKNDSPSYTDNNILVPDQNYVLDKNVTTLFNTGPYNCGGRCAHKFIVKNNRVLAMTSDGDTMRNDCEADEYAGHEEGKPIQHRSCVRGYSYIQQNYQPNRLKYPLFQTGEIGDITGFKRISWEEAMTRLVDAIKEAQGRQSELGYIPVSMLYDPNLSGYLGGPYVVSHGNASTGGVEGAKYDTVGANAQCNSSFDRFNTKFLLSWALDPSRATYHQVNSHWKYQKMKELNPPIPIVVVTSTMNDTAAMSTTGASVVINATGTVPTWSSSGTTVDIPGWIGIRPATDGAVMMAMMYVIWKHERHDKDFLRKHSFGFFADEEGQWVDSYAPNEATPMLYMAGVDLVTPADYTYQPDGKITASKTISAFSTYADQSFAVPKDASFEYQLEKLEADWAPSAGTPTDKYKGVLNYAAKLSGMPAKIIEALAFKYSEPFMEGKGEAAMLDVGGGANRADNGGEWAWLCIALCSICGYINKKGGGTGFNMLANPDDFAIKKPHPTAGTNYTTTFSLMRTPYGGNIHASIYSILTIPFVGTDGRSKEQIISDVRLQTGGFDGNGRIRTSSNGAVAETSMTPVDISTKIENKSVLGEAAHDFPLQLDVMIFHETNFVTTNPNINKSIKGMKAMKFACTMENQMSPTALYSRLVLPRTTHFEQNSSIETTTQGTSTVFLRQKLCEPIYETRSFMDFYMTLIQTLATGVYTEVRIPESSEEALKAEYEQHGVTQLFEKYQYTMPTWEEFKAKGYWEAQAPSTDPIIGFRDLTPPADKTKLKSDPVNSGKGLENTTGLINFHSPFWQIRLNMKGYGAANASGPAGLHKAVEDVPGYREAEPNRENRQLKFRGAGWRFATAQYFPVREGYEKFFKDCNPNNEFTGYVSPVSGRTYKLMYLTNKSRNRAHSALDSTAMIKDQFPQTVKLNPVTAAERGIRDGEMIYVYNDRGCTYIPAEITNQVLPGIVSIEHGAWYRAHPSLKTKVWIYNDITGESKPYQMPVDVGGAENILTDDDFTYDPVFIPQSLAAQTGPCEISKTKPE